MEENKQTRKKDLQQMCEIWEYELYHESLHGGGDGGVGG